jgi:hypothetical protein
MASKEDSVVINSYSELQAYITGWLKAHGVDADGAPHGSFWDTMSYQDFTTGSVPGFKSVKVLIIGDGKNSNIVQALNGTGLFDPDTGRYPRMPANGPYMDADEIAPITAWIDKGCPQ